MYVIDYAFSRPSPQAIKQAGFWGVARYLSKSPGKNLSATERDTLHGAGLSICLVWETTADRAGKGSAAGASDARDANAQADALGYPADCVIFYAVDFDATPSAVQPYFDGVRSVPGRPIGVYGGIRIVDPLMANGSCAYGWQTAAWSSGKVSTIAHMYQYIGHGHGVAVIPNQDYDDNTVLHPFPAWGLSGSTTGGFLMALTDAEQADLLKKVRDTDARTTNIQTVAAKLDQLLPNLAAAIAHELNATGAGGGLSEAQIEAACARALGKTRLTVT